MLGLLAIPARAIVAAMLAARNAILLDPALSGDGRSRRGGRRWSMPRTTLCKSAQGRDIGPERASLIAKCAL